MSRDVSILHPELQGIIVRLKADCERRGLPLLITETFRTAAEQNALYAQGRTREGTIVTNAKYPRSPHNWGIAFDFCRDKKGMEYDDSDGFFGQVGAIARGYGLAWGGDWPSFPDRPHLEMAKYKSIDTLIAFYGTPENFRRSWGTMIEYRNTFAVYPKVEDAPDWAKDMLYELMGRGIIAGDGNEDIQNRVMDMSEFTLKALAYSHRENDELREIIKGLEQRILELEARA